VSVVRMPRVGALILVGAVGVGCAIDNALVDGRCADGFVRSTKRCVAEVEPVKVDVDAGQPAPPVNPIEPDASVPDDPRFVHDPPPLVPDPPLYDAGVPDTGPPAPLCLDDLVSCHGACIPVDADGANCGACGKICSSNICIAGECIGAVHGDVVAFGQDFRGVPSAGVEARALVNSVMIPTSDPIRLLSFEAGADPVTVNAANALIYGGVRARGRDIVFGRTYDASKLESATLSRERDVVVIHGVSDGEVTALAARWAVPLLQFAKKGGVIIVLDDGLRPVPSLLAETGLLAVSGHTVLPPGVSLDVAVQGDVVGSKLPSPFVPFGNAVSFQGAPAMSNELAWVVRTGSDGGEREPVVIHRTVR
jgi:hypothetical protein